MKSEREATLKVLVYLREIDRRNLFAERGFSSLFDFCTKELHYSEAAAHRRISSMCLLRALPEIEPMVESGSLSLSTLAAAQSFFRAEKIKDRVRVISPSLTEISVVLEDKTLKEIEELRGLLARSNIRLNLRETLVFSIKSTLERYRPKVPKKPLPMPEVNEQVPSCKKKPREKPSRFIPAEVKRQVWYRDNGECGYISLETQRKCTSRYNLQFDHIVPHAKGGRSEYNNLRLRCSTHNQEEAVKIYGLDNLSKYIPRLR